MEIRCPKCGERCEVDFEPVIGQHIICPFCGVKFSYGVTSDDVGHKDLVAEQSMTVMAVCPYCGHGEPVEEECVGQVGVCLECQGEFTIMPNAKGIPFKEPNAEGGESSASPVSKGISPASPSAGMGCLLIVLVSFAIALSSSYFNYGAVALSAVMMLLAILIYLRNRAIRRCGHAVSFARLIHRFGGIWALPATYVVLFLLFSLEMKSCYKEQQESAKQSAIRDAEIKKAGGWCIVRECPECHCELLFWNELQPDGSFVLKHNGREVQRSLKSYHYSVRCENCGRYVDLGVHL